MSRLFFFTFSYLKIRRAAPYDKIVNVSTPYICKIKNSSAYIDKWSKVKAKNCFMTREKIVGALISKAENKSSTIFFLRKK